VTLGVEFPPTYRWAAAGLIKPAAMARKTAKQRALRNKLRSDDASDDTSADMGDIARGVIKTAFPFFSYEPL
jgi:hypothetical protein